MAPLTPGPSGFVQASYQGITHLPDSNNKDGKQLEIKELRRVVERGGQLRQQPQG